MLLCIKPIKKEQTEPCPPANSDSLQEQEAEPHLSASAGQAQQQVEPHPQADAHLPAIDSCNSRDDVNELLQQLELSGHVSSDSRIT